MRALARRKEKRAVAAPRSNASPLVAAILEVRRELSMRTRVYAKQVAAGTLSPDDATTRWYNLKVAHDRLVALATEEGSAAELPAARGNYLEKTSAVFDAQGRIEWRPMN